MQYDLRESYLRAMQGGEFIGNIPVENVLMTVIMWLFSRTIWNVKSRNLIGFWAVWNLPFRTADSVPEF